ncbi:uncharacterized protein [Emydura macquarii macquarii]|uniref:uncharacterized protein isoform X1 n=1 Tax=Emydura macquarii macquarii TaxID=1129001 RepID=UPI00352A3151
MITKSKDLVLGYPLTVFVPHEVEALMTREKTQAFSHQRIAQYEVILLAAENITLQRCSILNPATLLPEPDLIEEPHDCCKVVDVVEQPRSDLTDVPLSNPDQILFTDGSSFVREGHRYTGAAVTSLFVVLWAEPLPASLSAQAAELVALAKACELSKDLAVNIYTDSKYAFGICHAVGALWKQRGFLTSTGSKIANAKQVEDLLNAIMLPREIAVMHCAVHTNATDDISLWNRQADYAAKEAALQPLPLSVSAPVFVPGVQEKEISNAITAEEKARWKSGALLQPVSLDCEVHPYQPGDRVWIKISRRSSPLTPVWEGPFQVLLTTHTAVKVQKSPPGSTIPK